MTQTEDDVFDSPMAAPTLGPPSMKQLATGDVKRTRIYAPDTDKEQARETTGRLVLIDLSSAKFEEAIKSNIDPEKTQDRWTIDIHVLSGEPIAERLDKDGDVTGVFDPPKVAPFILSRFYSSHNKLGGQLGDLKAKGKKYALGVIGTLPASRAGNSKPYVLLAPNDEDKTVARQYLAKLAATDPY